MSDFVYILVHVSDRQTIKTVAEELEKIDSLTRWDAVDGDFRIIARFTGAKESDFESLRSVKHSLCEVTSGSSQESIVDPELCHSYALIEVQQEHCDRLAKEILQLDSTVSCEITSGRFNLMALLSGERFDSVDKKIDTKIGRLDGILRIKKTHVLSSQSV